MPLCAADSTVLLACCQLGAIPAVLRFALPSNPLDLRLQVSHGKQLIWLRWWWWWKGSRPFCIHASQEPAGILPGD